VGRAIAKAHFVCVVAASSLTACTIASVSLAPRARGDGRVSEPERTWVRGAAKQQLPEFLDTLAARARPGADP
jgi:hypothetical protein